MADGRKVRVFRVDWNDFRPWDWVALLGTRPTDRPELIIDDMTWEKQVCQVEGAGSVEQAEVTLKAVVKDFGLFPNLIHLYPIIDFIWGQEG